jgi:hypothetical protein
LCETAADASIELAHKTANIIDATIPFAIGILP